MGKKFDHARDWEKREPVRAREGVNDGGMVWWDFDEGLTKADRGARHRARLAAHREAKEAEIRRRISIRESNIRKREYLAGAMF